MEGFIYFLLNLFMYGFIGWVIEELYCYCITSHFQEDGFLKGPFKPMYGITMSILIGGGSNLNTYLLIMLCFIVPTVVEYITGYLMEKYFNKTYWDYSKQKFNYKGIICLKFSLYWTVLTYIGVKYFQQYVINNIYYYIKDINIYLIILLLLILGADEILSLKKYIIGIKDPKGI